MPPLSNAYRRIQCSVWPAFWTLDIKNGDLGGEIDIVGSSNKTIDSVC
jgi:hypothetical protein